MNLENRKLHLTSVFEKNAEAYIAEHDGKRRYKVIVNQGGSRSSKTYSILQLLVQIAIKSNKQIDIAGISVPHLKMGVLNDMPRVMDGFGLNFYDMFKATDKTITFPSGGVINFIALDKLGSAHGGARDILYVNEANHHKYPIVEQLMMRTAECTFIDFNPTSRFWAHDLVDKSPQEAILIKSTYKDNQYCPPNIVKFIESKRGDGTNNFWRVYGLGEIGISEGLIFNNFEKSNFDIYRFDKYYNGIDWGFSGDPFAFVRVAVEQNNLYICQEIYQTALLNRTSADMVKPIVRNEIVWCDSAEPKSVQEYISYGIKAISAKKGAGSIASGIKKIQGFNKVIIHENCHKLYEEFCNYKWKVDRNNEPLPQPESGFDHGIDAIRYALSAEMIYKKPQYDARPRVRSSGGSWMT